MATERTEMRFVATLGAVSFKPPKTSQYDPTPKGGAIELPLSVKRPQLPDRPRKGYRLEQWEREPQQEPTEDALRDAWDLAHRAAWLRERGGKRTTEPCTFSGPLTIDGEVVETRCVDGFLFTVDGEVQVQVVYGEEDEGDVTYTLDDDEGEDDVSCETCSGRGTVTVTATKAEPTKEEEAKAFEAFTKNRRKDYERTKAEMESEAASYSERLIAWNAKAAEQADPFKVFAMLGAIAALLGGSECEVIIRPIESDVLPGFNDLFGGVPQLEAGAK